MNSSLGGLFSCALSLLFFITTTMDDILVKITVSNFSIEIPYPKKLEKLNWTMVWDDKSIVQVNLKDDITKKRRAPSFNVK